MSASETQRQWFPSFPRLLALGGILVLLGTTVSILLDITAVVGGSRTLMGVVIGALVGATIIARLISVRTAIVAGVLVTAGGLYTYLETADLGGWILAERVDDLLADSIYLLSGVSVIHLLEAGSWAIGFAPGPVFLSWYLATRRRYAPSAAVGGLALGVLVLTGDATGATVLVGSLAGLAAVGFGELERRGGSLTDADLIVVVGALAIVAAIALSGLSGGAMGPLGQDTGVDEPETLDEAVAGADDVAPITGSVGLSEEVHFTVEGEEPFYWRTGVYDRFTGDRWVSTGDRQSLDQSLAGPESASDSVRHTITFERAMNGMPAAAEPRAVDDEALDWTEIDTHGQIHPTEPRPAGDSYTVESEIIDPSPTELRAAGTDYPEWIDRYLQVPEGTSDEFREETAAITADAETPYDTAVAIERYMHEEYEYTLEVEVPEGNAAEEFLLERDEGYCVYFATTMAQMLRSEGIPARYATGYSSGNATSDGWEVRGADGHAWTEVYFPDHGWVLFEPTPPSRDDIHEAWIGDEDEQADEDEEENGDENDDDQLDPRTDQNESEDEQVDNETVEEAIPDETGDEEDDGFLPVAITPRLVGTIGIVFAGLGLTIRRTGVDRRAVTEVRLRRQRPGSSPARDVERAYGRLERALARGHRGRRPAETPREYVSALELADERDRRVEAVRAHFERTRYGRGVDEETAGRVVAEVDELVDELVWGPVAKNGRPGRRNSR